MSQPSPESNIPYDFAPSSSPPGSDSISELAAAFESAIQKGDVDDAFVKERPELASMLLKLNEVFGLDSTSPVANQTLTHPVEEQRQPKQIAHFSLVRELGRGRFGIVYLADDQKLKRQVAVKIARSDIASSPELRKRFLGEAEASAKLEHPGIVSLHEAGEAGETLYIVMAYIEGITLAEYLLSKDRPPMPPRAAAALVAQLCRAVEHGHQRGVVHRDLKPANIMLATDPKTGELFAPLKPIILDFGLARTLNDELSDTRSSMMIGTPLYMSPEQAMCKKEVAAPSDLFSLAAILYELLTGKPPFVGDSLPDVLRQLEECTPTSVRALRPEVPIDLETICLKGLCETPADRYSSASAMADDLSRFENGEPIAARPPTKRDRVRYWCRKHRRVDEAAMIVFCLAAVMIIFGLGGVIALVLTKATANVNQMVLQTLPFNGITTCMQCWFAWLAMKMKRDHVAPTSTKAGIVCASLLAAMAVVAALGWVSPLPFYDEHPVARLLVFMLCGFLCVLIASGLSLAYHALKNSD